MPLDPSSAFLAVEGTNLPGIPQASGFAMNQSEMAIAMQRATRTAALSAHLLQSDTRAQYMTGLMAQAVAGPNATQWMQQNGRAASMGLGMVANNQYIAPLIGGNVLDMYSGITTGIANAGRMQGNIVTAQGTQRGSFGGTGFVTDRMGELATRSMQDYFFNPTAGGSNLERTHGFDRTDLGQLAAVMGMRGNLSGMHMGDVMKIDDKSQLEQLKSQYKSNPQMMEELSRLDGNDFSVPQYAFKLNERTAQRINDQLSAGAKALRSVKDIFGAKPIGELARIAEELTGMDVTQISGAREIAGRMDRAKTFGRTHGFNPQAVLLEQKQMKDMMVQMGMGSTVSATASESVQQFTQAAWDNNRVARNAAANNGVYMQERSREEVAALTAADVSQTIQEQPEISGALYALQTRQNLDPETRARLEDQVRNVSTNLEGDTPEERYSSYQQRLKDLDASIGEATGRTAGEWVEAGGGEQSVQEKLDASSRRKLVTAAMAESRRRMFSDNVPELLDRVGLADAYGADASLTEGAVGGLYEHGSATDRNAIIEAVKAGQPGAIEDVINNMAGATADQKKALLQNVTGLREQIGDDASAKLLTEGFGVLGNNDMLINASSTADLATQAALQNKTDDAFKFDGTGIAEPDLVKQLAEGFFGGKDISDVMVAEYAAGKGTDLGTKNKDGGLDMTDASAQSMFEKYGFLASEGFSSVEDLKTQLSTSTGYQKFSTLMQDKGHKLMDSTAGQTYQFDGKDFSSASDELRKKQNEIVYAEMAKDPKAFAAKVDGPDTNGLVKNYSEWVKAEKTDKGGGDPYAAWIQAEKEGAKSGSGPSKDAQMSDVDAARGLKADMQKSQDGSLSSMAGGITALLASIRDEIRNLAINN